jgi:hypothetical protein
MCRARVLPQPGIDLYQTIMETLGIHPVTTALPTRCVP